ncbi:MAG TPA: hypothetical protein VMW41_02290 [Candidatus Bathyarchaeia archaeon]|nr:hypothetical protein [Candidatus Bathyarchaeia archaeon]
MTKKSVKIILILFFAIALVASIAGVDFNPGAVPEEIFRQWKGKPTMPMSKGNYLISPPGLYAIKFDKFLFLPLGFFDGYWKLSSGVSFSLWFMWLNVIEFLSVIAWWMILSIGIYQIIKRLLDTKVVVPPRRDILLRKFRAKIAGRRQ